MQSKAQIRYHHMERPKTLSKLLLIFLSSFLLLPLAVRAEAMLAVQAPGLTPRPVCVSQYALANYACSMIPYSPLPPPAPTTPSPEAHHGRGNEHGHGRRHGHRHRHHHRHHGTREEDDCCRWLYEIDNDCVCDMLVRLPNFLSRPVHEYSIFVGETCNVTYTCGGRVIRKEE